MRRIVRAKTFQSVHEQMIQRSPIRKISAKRLRELGGRVPFSTIRRTFKPIRKATAGQRKRIAVRRTIRERWWDEGRRICGICDKQILTFEEMVNDHIEPGSGKDDSEANQQPAHGICNLIKGSNRNFKL